MKFWLLLLLCVFVGCRNPYADFYKDTTGGKNLRDASVFVQAQGVDLRRGSDPATDEINMIENGFVMVGYSSFNAGDIMTPENHAIEHAGKIGASICVVYQPKHTGSMQGSNTIYIPGKYAGFSINTPTQINRFDYLVTYWMKENAKYTLGVRSTDLSPADKTKLQSNKGVKVVAVIKGTPAYRADLLRGDIVKRINDIDVEDREHLGRLLNDNKGKTISVSIIRDAVPSVLSVTLD